MTRRRQAPAQQHPRLRYYPHHADYLGLEPEFRPFAMFTDQPNYRSPSVNTDAFGLREQYDMADDPIDFETLRSSVSQCNVILGGSTVFGVDATSDRTTVSHFLNQPDRPCLNLGVRGATGQQELILFLLFKKYLPPVKNVVLFTGVNNCALAARPGTRVYRGFGGVFYEGVLPSPGRQQELMGVARYRLIRFVDRAYTSSRFVRKGLNLALGRGQQAALGQRATFEEKFEETMRLVENDLETWGQLQSASGCKVHFVLQPALGWTARPQTRVESECFDADLELFPDTRLFASREFYLQYRDRLAQACRLHGIDFHDANEWIDSPSFAREEIFTDVCHLTDAGNRIVADLIRQRLCWAGSAC